MENNIALYVHYPFCVRKCPYCDFNSHKKDIELADSDYIKRLVNDFSKISHYLQGRKLISVFLGGGTPSLVDAKDYAPLFKEIEPYLEGNCEITIEANPGTVDRDKLKAYKDLGVNRISLGVQSFNDKALKRLGRIHDSKTAIAACNMAVDTGFDNVNFDIMHSLPGQSVNEALSDLKIAVDLGATHLSWYELTIEEDTLFGKNPPTLPCEDILIDIEDKGFNYLKEQGFCRYEVSAFTKKDRCVHNENYWLFGDYLGIGAGAHSKVSFGDKILRRANAQSPLSYMGTDEVFYEVDSEDVAFEFMLNRLRLFDKVKKDEYEKATGHSFFEVERKLKRASSLSLLSFDIDNNYYLTEKGKIMLNDILEMFLRDS